MCTCCCVSLWLRLSDGDGAVWGGGRLVMFSVCYQLLCAQSPHSLGTEHCFVGGLMQDLDHFLIYKHARAQMEMVTQGQPATSPPWWRPQGRLMLPVLLLLCVKEGACLKVDGLEFRFHYFQPYTPLPMKQSVGNCPPVCDGF